MEPLSRGEKVSDPEYYIGKVEKLIDETGRAAARSRTRMARGKSATTLFLRRCIMDASLRLAV